MRPDRFKELPVCRLTLAQAEQRIADYVAIDTTLKIDRLKFPSFESTPLENSAESFVAGIRTEDYKRITCLEPYSLRLFMHDVTISPLQHKQFKIEVFKSFFDVIKLSDRVFAHAVAVTHL